MTDDKQRELARKELSPIEDIKGAIRYLRELDPAEEVREFIEHAVAALDRAVEVLDPHQSDVRAVLPEEDSRSDSEEKR